MRKPILSVAVPMAAVMMCVSVATAADKNYTPQGSGPYNWSDTAAWGGALPGADDVATIENSGLLVHPLVLEAAVDATVSSCIVDTGVLVVESGGSLTVTTEQNSKTQPPHNGFSIAKTAGSTGVITNYGTISTVSLDFGDYMGGKGALARFDNFGTLNISKHFRMGTGGSSGTPSVFYNHEGATFNKTGGGSYTFYMATKGGGDSTIINEGTMVCGSGTETWSGNSGAKNEIIMRKSGTFDPGPFYKIGHAASTTRFYLQDKSRLSGATKYNVGAVDNSKGYFTLSNESAFATTKDVNLGLGSKALGSFFLADDAIATFNGNCNLGGGATTTGIVEFVGRSMGTFGSNCRIGYGGAKSFGSLTVSDNASVTFNGLCGVGISVGGVGEMHLKDSACVTTRNQLYVCSNEGGCSTGLVTLAGSSILTNMSGALVIGSYSNTCGRMTLSGNSRVVSTSNVYLGHGNDKSGAGAQGFLTLADNASAEFSGNYLHLADIKYTAGTLEMYGDSTLGVSNLFAIGKAQYATGIVTVANNARVDAGEIQVAGAWLSRGLLVVTNAASVACTNMTLCASNTSDGDLYVSGGTVDVTNLTIAAYGTSDGCVVVADEGRLSCSNIAMAAADQAVANMTVTNGGFAQSIGIQLGTGTKSFAHLNVADGAVLLASNITLAVSTTASTGILEIAEGGIVSNDYIKIGCNSDSARGILKMSGGSLFISGKSASDPIYLNQRLARVSAWIRGWGKVAFYNPRESITEWPNTRTRCIVHYGQVIADGEGEERDLDFSRFGSLSYQNTQANTSGTNGWFAVNKGRLKLPRCLPRKTASYTCSGDCYDLNYANETSAGTTSNRLANTFSCVFQGAALNNFVFSELYAPDRSDIPAGLNALGADRTISVWRVGLFADGPEIDEPVSPETFTSAKIHFRFPNDNLDGLAVMCVYRHDGTANGSWRLVGRTGVRKGWPVVPASVSAPSEANWNLGWFAVVGREKPFGTTFIVR